MKLSRSKKFRSPPRCGGPIEIQSNGRRCQSRVPECPGHGLKRINRCRIMSWPPVAHAGQFPRGRDRARRRRGPTRSLCAQFRRAGALWWLPVVFSVILWSGRRTRAVVTYSSYYRTGPVHRYTKFLARRRHTAHRPSAPLNACCRGRRVARGWVRCTLPSGRSRHRPPCCSLVLRGCAVLLELEAVL